MVRELRSLLRAFRSCSLLKGCPHASPRPAPLVDGDTAAGLAQERGAATIPGVDSQEADAAAIYRTVFGWTKGLRPEDSERLRKAATIAIDDPKIDALIRQARPALKALREAAAIRRCDWGIEPISADDLGKGHLDVVDHPTGQRRVPVGPPACRRAATVLERHSTTCSPA